MKNYKLLAFFVVLLLASSLTAQQPDDIYFNPSRDKVVSDDFSSNKQNFRKERDYSYEDEDRYEDETYDYYDDYDYYYSSRIRRFHRPYYGFSFFDPVYVDMFYYDPFYMPGATMLIYDDVFAFNSWYRWNRWNNWSFGLNPWGFNGWNSWAYDPWFRWNSFGPNFYSYNSFYNYGFAGGFYCPPTWGSGYIYNTVNDIRSNTYYGPRTAGSTRVPQVNDREVRREAPKDVTNTPRTRDREVLVPQDRNPSDYVTPREESRTTPSTRARAHEERRARESGSITPRESTPRQTETPRRTYDQPRDNPFDRSPSSNPGWDSGRSSRSSEPRSSGSSGSSSGPRSSSSSRRGGNN